jgi:hypothetical protein
MSRSRIAVPCFIALLLGVSLFPVRAAAGPRPVSKIVQLAELTPSDGVSYDGFGITLAVSGDVVVVGSFNHKAYVFVKPAGGWTNMTETAQLTAAPGPNQAVSWSVAISGDTIVVGAPDAGPQFGGLVYLFQKPAGGWQSMTQTATLSVKGAYNGDLMGYAVAVDGDNVVAGAPSCTGDGNYGAGAAYLWSKPAAGWVDMTETSTLHEKNPISCDLYGSSVAISGGTAVVGKPNAGYNPPTGPGSISVFSEPAGGWTTTSYQTASLTSTYTSSVFNGLGAHVAISGNNILAGGANGANGAAYLYEQPAGGWVDMTETATLTNSRSKKVDYFGSSVAIGGAIALSGSPGTVPSHGAVSLYNQPAAGWQTTSTPSANLSASDGASGAEFGRAVATDGTTVVVDAVAKANGPLPYVGAAYVFGAQ